MPRSLFDSVLGATFRVVNRFVPWHKLPPYVGVLNLLAFRDELRAKNLHDTGVAPKRAGGNGGARGTPKCTPRDLNFRSVAGTCNDLSDPAMGREGARFGRNMPLADVWPEAGDALLTPSPRAISRRLMARDEFKPATTLNL